MVGLVDHEVSMRNMKNGCKILFRGLKERDRERERERKKRKKERKMRVQGKMDE
jgi:hypothetical protein